MDYSQRTFLIIESYPVIKKIDINNNNNSNDIFKQGKPVS